MRRNAPDEAIASFRVALETNPRDPAALFGLGWASQQKGELGQAESYYLQAIPLAAEARDADTEYFARFDLGTLYAQEKKSEQAVSAFSQTMALVDGAPDTFGDRLWVVSLNLGLALLASGREAEARAAIARAAAARPDDPSVRDAQQKLARPADAGADAR